MFKKMFYVAMMIVIAWMFCKGFADTTSKEGWYAGTSLYKSEKK